jgi:glycerol-3-phosphate dehydrogenase (NAD(P)+)
MAEVAILGAGAWGTALAIALARGGRSVVLCTRRQEHLEALRAARENQAYLPGVSFPPELGLATLAPATISAARFLMLAIPSRFARPTMEPLANVIPSGATLVSLTKGIEPDSLMTMTAMLHDIAPHVPRIAVLSGPGFAVEVARGKPAAVVAAARNEDVAREVQALFAVRPLRVYHSVDVTGVEFGGVVKNIIAIAAGISDGLELGSSARAGLITRGLAEIMRLAEAAGGKSETMAGLAGLGDLVLTCAGDLSRNRKIGLEIARSGQLPARAQGQPVAEGVANTRSVKLLAERLGVEMPIVAAVYRVLYEASPASDMVDELLSRELKAEFGQGKASKN